MADGAVIDQWQDFVNGEVSILADSTYCALPPSTWRDDFERCKEDAEAGVLEAQRI